jgi:hypothetical protein
MKLIFKIEWLFKSTKKEDDDDDDY